MNLLLAVFSGPEFATKMREMLWTAYGKPVKVICIIVLVVCVGGPFLAFLRRLVR